ncbi:MAG: hypothetical protein ACI33K_02085 [Clostridiaceae bacterium]
MINYNYLQSYNYTTDAISCAAFSSYANNFYAIAMDIAVLAVSFFVIALISVISIIIALELLVVILVILSIIREAGKQSTKLAIGHFIPLM